MTRRDLLLLVNPHAGGGLGALAGRRAERQLQASSLKLELRETAGPGEASEIAKAARESGRDLIVVGGDGTVHEAVNGFVDPQESATEQHLGLIPVGTGNDYVKAIGVPRDDVQGAVDIIVRGRTRCVDLGLMASADLPTGQELFVNNLGAGFLADATRGYEKLAPRRAGRITGRWPYVLGGLWGLWQFRPVAVDLDFDGEARAGPLAALHCALGRFCGGGLDLTPQAEVDDGLFTCLVVSGRSRWRLLADWPRLERGRHGQVEGASCHEVTSLKLAGEGFWIHADGELRYLASGQLKVEILPSRLKVFAPDKQRTGAPAITESR